MSHNNTNSYLLEIKDKQTLDNVMNSNNNIIILYVYATWCSPCSLLYPKMEVLASKYISHPKRILFCKVNSETDVIKNVQGLPTIQFWTSEGNQKKLYNTVLGADYKRIEDTLNSLLSPEEIVRSNHHNSSNDNTPFGISNKGPGLKVKPGLYKSYGSL